MKVILFGDATPGKAMFVKKYLTNLFPGPGMTVGVDFEYKSISVDGQKLRLSIWDFGVEQRFKYLLSTYTRGALGGLFVYDVTSYSSIAHMGDWLSIIRKKLKPEDEFPIIAVGIVLDEKIEREVSANEAIKIAKSLKLNGYIECNLQTGKNVERVFEAIAILILTDEGHQRRIKKEAKDQTKDEENYITYTRRLEKRLRILEAENLRLEEQIRLEKQKNQLKLKQDLNKLQNMIDKYKKMGL